MDKVDSEPNTGMGKASKGIILEGQTFHEDDCAKISSIN